MPVSNSEILVLKRNDSDLIVVYRTTTPTLLFFYMCNLPLIAILALIFRAAWKHFSLEYLGHQLYKSLEIFFKNLGSVFPYMVRETFSYNTVEKYGLARKTFDFRSEHCFSTFWMFRIEIIHWKKKKKKMTDINTVLCKNCQSKQNGISVWSSCSPLKWKYILKKCL